jgi:glycosyltransferase involved in cell wall biosynthesis
MIVLNMIVKDEAKNMPRCLKSVENVVDKYIICDTGSTDNTKEVIRELLKGKDYEIYDHEWVNFGHNRELALQLAYKSGANYALILDADWEFIKGDFSNLTADAYYLTVNHGGMQLKLPYLLGLHKEWHWKGPAHNYVVGNGKFEDIDSLVISYVGEGCKSHCTSREKFLKDAALFEK